MSTSDAMNTPPRTPAVETADEPTALRHEREHADRAYNDALTALDRAIQQRREFPAPASQPDETRLSQLNNRWRVLPEPPTSGALGWLKRRLWAWLGPSFQAQQDFNATLVDHLNREAAAQRQVAETLARTATICREEFERLVDFESTLVQYAQTITAYVDTKDRDVAAVPYMLASATHAAIAAMQSPWEAMLARDRRFQSEVDEVRSTLGVAHRAILTLKRELESRALSAPGESRTVSAPGEPGETPLPSPDAPRTAHQAPGPPPASALPAPSAGTALDSYKYVGFEDQFRGAQAEIRAGLSAYVAIFEGASDVLDIGCGRGEFLDLLREAGITAKGVDTNEEMVGTCRDRGLQASTGDALGYLLAQPDESLGGLFGAQIVEHLEPDYLLRLLDAASHKLRPGAPIVLETINAACWFAFFSSYIRDITHVRPLHPDTLRYLVLASGFQDVEVRFSAPFPEASKLQPIPVGASAQGAESAAIFNENVEKLNSLLFTYLDYAIVARRA
ncbi:MAG: class I SAM-dependent methyltransferase [Vicinamibacterales bacterium]